jgi:hypothetical protein
MENSNWRISVKGMLVATALAAMFTAACMVPTEQRETPDVVAIFGARMLTFFAGLGAPFERALAGLLVGLAFFGVWLAGSILYAI